MRRIMIAIVVVGVAAFTAAFVTAHTGTTESQAPTTTRTGTPTARGTPTQSTPQAAAVPQHASAQVKPPKVKQVRYTCTLEGAIVSLGLRNPNRVELGFIVGLAGVDVQQAQAVNLPGKTAERVRFDGIVDGAYTIQVFDALGETVALGEVVVDCPPVTQAVYRM